jgi:SAM-dependent methyltransferase
MTSDAPIPVRALTRCLGCGSDRLDPLPLAYEFHGRFPLVECRACGLRFLRVQPTAEGLARLYSAEYFDRDFRCGRSAVAYDDEAAFRDENRDLLDAFARLIPPGRLLEVGAAGGWLLKQARERGWTAHGVELSGEAVARARALGLDVFHGELADARFPDAYFDLAYMGDVLEHVPDARAVLAEVVRVLRPGGYLYLRGPVTTHSIARRLGLALYRLAGRTIVLREPPYHLWEFTPRSLARLFRTAGLEVIESRQSKIPPGRPHGDKGAATRLVMNAIDTINLPLTRACNVLGDRIVLVGRTRAGHPAPTGRDA